MTYRIDVRHGADHQQSASDDINRALRQFNESVLGPYTFTPVSAAAYSDDGQLQGGATGYYGLDCLQVEGLWVDPALRGQGLGERLLTEIEAQAASAGIRLAKLETASFQARSFYEKQGYVVFGELDDYPPGHRYFFMRKALLPAER